MQKRRDAKKIVLVLFSFALLAILLTSFFYFILTYKEVRTIEMKIKVGDYVGFNLDNRYLEFGTVMPGGTSLRNMDLTNNYAMPLFVEIEIVPKSVFLEKTNAIKPGWVTISKNNFLVESNNITNIAFSVKMPDNASYGNYSSTAIIKFLYVK